MSFVPPVAFGDTLSYRVVKRSVFPAEVTAFRFPFVALFLFAPFCFRLADARR